MGGMPFHGKRTKNGWTKFSWFYLQKFLTYFLKKTFLFLPKFKLKENEKISLAAGYIGTYLANKKKDSFAIM